jgi:hypothetical protein
MKSETLRNVKWVKLRLCLLKHHIVNMYGAVHVRIQAFLTLTLEKGELSGFSRRSLYARGKRMQASAPVQAS